MNTNMDTRLRKLLCSFLFITPVTDEILKCFMEFFFLTKHEKISKWFELGSKHLRKTLKQRNKQTKAFPGLLSICVLLRLCRLQMSKNTTQTGLSKTKCVG